MGPGLPYSTSALVRGRWREPVCSSGSHRGGVILFSLLGGGGLYPLPSDGWEQGDISATAVVAGALHVAVTSDGARAWVGEHGSAVLWPAGYQVQGATLEIIDEVGTAVAREGDYVPAAGGLTALPLTSILHQQLGVWAERPQWAFLAPRPLVPDWLGP